MTANEITESLAFTLMQIRASSESNSVTVMFQVHTVKASGLHYGQYRMKATAKVAPQRLGVILFLKWSLLACYLDGVC